MYQIDKNDIKNIIYGATLLGSGGGGGLQMALQIWDSMPDDISVAVLEEGDVADRSGCVIAFMGSPLSAGALDATPLVDAFNSMNAMYYDTLSVAVAVEVGPVNSLAPMLVANAKNVTVLDADGAGRAVPQLTMLTYANTIPIAPVVLTNGKDVNTTTWVGTPTLAEQMLRPIVSAPEFGGYGALACWTMTGAQMQANALWGTLSQARNLGAEILAGSNAQSIAEYISRLRDGGPASVVASGTLKTGPTVSTGGFDLGTCTITQQDGSIITIFIQNENLTLFTSKSTYVLATAPDLICYWDNTTNLPFTNVELAAKENANVSIIKVPRLTQVDAFPAVIAGYQKGVENLGYGGIIDSAATATSRLDADPKVLTSVISYPAHMVRPRSIPAATALS